MEEIGKDRAMMYWGWWVLVMIHDRTASSLTASHQTTDWGFRWSDLDNSMTILRATISWILFLEKKTYPRRRTRSTQIIIWIIKYKTIKEFHGMWSLIKHMITT
jgi:hypothetical protein